MVRPKVDEPKKQFTIMLKPSVVERIDKLAKKLELSRSQFMANLIDMGLEDAEILNKTGALDIIRIVGKLTNKLRIDLLSGKAKLSKDGSLEINNQ